MNIYDILIKLGYDVHCFDENGIYTVSFSKERVKRYEEKIKLGEISYDGDLNEKVRVYAKDIGFNGFGDLYVFFYNADNVEECIDGYEYRNMNSDELFN